MIDRSGRDITYLRISVTDKCNLRCRYCMPAEGVCKKEHKDMLTEDELITAVEAAAALGIRKVRITGGEPLVKKNILSICRRTAAVPGIEEVCLTTNGTALPRLAEALREAGVHRLNLSLDTLDPEKFAYMTRTGKLEDFFAAYPKMDGLILTLHETRIPLLKLKHQKLDKIERVKYVTSILHDSCKKLGKELIVRPFASIEEDYEMMTRAYEQISPDMVIMDKWTQFDWSLTLPVNAFFRKIRRNPLLVETDIFGEYFGLGILPIMLRDHILKNFSYCESFEPVGYVSRIDRAGYHAFGDVNEVNYRIMEACLEGRDVDAAINAFFIERYGSVGPAVRALMERTEDIQRHIFNLKDYYFSEGSRFPAINHCKNHFYFEMMKEQHHLVSGEWFIPLGWQRGELCDLLKEKAQAVADTAALLTQCRSLEPLLAPAVYDALLKKFLNLSYVAQLWQALLDVFVHYTKYFELHKDAQALLLDDALNRLLHLEEAARAELGESFYVWQLSHNPNASYTTAKEPVQSFVQDIRDSFRMEKALHQQLMQQQLTDFVICGGGFEGHKIMKEVNFSDTYLKADGICRIPGTYRGKAFSTVNAHGWFSYELKSFL